MGKTGIMDKCRECEEEVDNFCCDAGLKDHYSGTLSKTV